jgi:hypothetical protein
MARESTWPLGSANQVETPYVRVVASRLTVVRAVSIPREHRWRWRWGRVRAS